MIYDDMKQMSTGIDWSQNGSLLASISKDKIASIFDPRQEGSAIKANTHEGARP